MDLLAVLQITAGSGGVIIGLAAQVCPVFGSWKKFYPHADRWLLRDWQRADGLWVMGSGLVCLLLAAQRNGWNLGVVRWPVFVLAVALEVAGFVRRAPLLKQLKAGEEPE